MLDQRAMPEAQRLLLYTELSVTQVAYAIGFQDPAYVSRFFTRHACRTPGSYRAATPRWTAEPAAPRPLTRRAGRLTRPIARANHLKDAALCPGRKRTQCVARPMPRETAADA
jgi:AraC-like DNA-binding protein